MHRPALPQRHPHAALGVHRQAVGAALGWVHDGERPPPAQSGLGVVVEHVHAPDPGVGVVGPPPVRAEAEPVGDRRPGQHHAQLAAGARHVERAAARARVVGHGADVEAAVGVAAAFVHPDRRVAEGLAEGAQRGVQVVGVGQQQLALGGDDVTGVHARAYDGGHGADVAAAYVPVVAELQHVAGHHVHPPQAPAAGPHGSFTVLGDGVGDGVRGDGHAALLGDGIGTDHDLMRSRHFRTARPG